jgi:hypothetical protein
VTIVGFSGTRIGMTEQQSAIVADLLRVIAPTEARHGDCVGADAEFHKIAAAQLGARIVVHPPTDPRLRAFCKGDEVLDPLPYLVRNTAIVLASNLLIATPASAMVTGGTWFTINEALRLERRTVIVHRDGRVEDR